MIDINDIISKITIEEKVSQLTQFNANIIQKTINDITGADISFALSNDNKGGLGSVLNFGEGTKKSLQEKYNSLKKDQVPLLFMQDIIHGCSTIFPIPLALGCTFDEELVENCAEVSGRESKSVGIDVTFSPMVDLVRDCRWGRVMESTGEDKYLNGEMGKAFIRGYHKGGLACCVKHFACYGAVESGRDYNTVDICNVFLFNEYLYAYHECLKEKPELVMTSFNSLNGKPINANYELLVNLLREKWGYNGVVITDYNALEEMIFQGYAQDKRECAKIGINNQIDIEMMSDCYINNLPKLVKDGIVNEKDIDRAVERVLKLKQDLGILDNHSGFENLNEYNQLISSDANKELALKSAEESFVLLKNNGVLPLKKETTISLVGPFIKERDILGAWKGYGKVENTTNVYEAFKNYLEKDVSCNEGCSFDLFDSDYSKIKNAVEVAQKNNVIIAFIGEHSKYSGEARSRANPTITDVQLELLKELKKTRKKIVGIIFAGRPLILTEAEKYLDAILYVWQPGSQGANAIVRTIYGINNPCGKLTMSFPRSVGQCPIHYDELHGGRRKNNDSIINLGYKGAFIDEFNSPLYPFGYGLSYSNFSISELNLSSDTMIINDKIKASIVVKNESNIDGYEIVQLYIRDVVSSILRPIKELKSYKRVKIKAYESKVVSFEIDSSMLSFSNEQGEQIIEKGLFEIMIGDSSENYLSKQLILI